MKATEAPGAVTVTIRTCARCDKDHEGLTFNLLTSPAGEWTHWALCPTVRQPVLLRCLRETPGTVVDVTEIGRNAKIEALQDLITNQTGHWVDRAKAMIAELRVDPFTPHTPEPPCDGCDPDRRCAQCKEAGKRSEPVKKPCPHCGKLTSESHLYDEDLHYGPPAYTCTRPEPAQPEPAAPVEMPEAVADVLARLHYVSQTHFNAGDFRIAAIVRHEADALEAFWRTHAQPVGITEELETILRWQSQRAHNLRDERLKEAHKAADDIERTITAVREQYAHVQPRPKLEKVRELAEGMRRMYTGLDGERIANAALAELDAAEGR